MSQIELKAKKRPTGKQKVKIVRNADETPGIFYFKGEQSIPISVIPILLRPIVYTSQTKVIKLEIEGEPGTHDCVLKDIQFDPVTDKIVHFDLMGIRIGKRLTVDIPIVLKGQAIGIRTGGLLQQNMHKVKVKCFPRHLVESIEVDITNLSIGHSVHIRELQNVENFEFVLPPEAVICSVMHPRVAPKEGEKEVAKS